MGRYCYGRGWQWTHPYHIVTNIFTVTTSAALQNSWNYVKYVSCWRWWCLQLLLITKHLLLLPKRMSLTPSNKICVGGGVGDEYDNKIFFSNLDNCVCAQVPAEPSLHWERMQGFQTQKRLYNWRCPSVIIKNDSTFSDAKTTLQLSMSVRHHHFLQNF